MNKITSPILSFDNTVTQASPDASANTVDDSFQKVLTAMLLESTLSGMGANPAEEGASTMPVMLSLLEQLLSRQVESASTASTASAAGQAGSLLAAAGAETIAPVSTHDQAEPSGRPVGGRITQGSHPGHVALDFSAPVGTQVQSTMSGKVVYAGWNNEGYGNLVIVENGPYQTYYAHLSSIPVTVGQSVSAGSVIGLSGSTGNSTGPHVHYEIRLNKAKIDPTQVTLNAEPGSTGSLA